MNVRALTSREFQMELNGRENGESLTHEYCIYLTLFGKFQTELGFSKFVYLEKIG